MIEKSVVDYVLYFPPNNIKTRCPSCGNNVINILNYCLKITNFDQVHEKGKQNSLRLLI